MLNFTKKNQFILSIFIITLVLGIITFLTFIDRSFIKLNEKNLQNLLIIDLVLVLSFFVIIFFEILSVVRDKNNESVSSKANIRYVTFFSLSTLLPSILIAIFSLFLFSFALEKYLDKKTNVIMKKGDMFILHGNCAHGSYGNTTEFSRPLYSITYIKKGEPFLVGKNANRKEFSLH